MKYTRVIYLFIYLFVVVVEGDNHIVVRRHRKLLKFLNKFCFINVLFIYLFFLWYFLSLAN